MSYVGALMHFELFECGKVHSTWWVQFIHGTAVTVLISDHLYIQVGK